MELEKEMRDDQIIQRQQNDARRIAMVYRQSVFLDTRLQAMEYMILTHPWMLMLNPDRWMRLVGDRQDLLLKKHDQEMMESAQKADAEAKKTKIQIVPANGAIKLVGLVLFIFSLQGCVTAGRYERDLAVARQEGFKDADTQCMALQNRLGQYMTGMQQRLAKLNQLNDDGSLKPAKTKGRK